MIEFDKHSLLFAVVIFNNKHFGQLINRNNWIVFALRKLQWITATGLRRKTCRVTHFGQMAFGFWRNLYGRGEPLFDTMTDSYNSRQVG